LNDDELGIRYLLVSTFYHSSAIAAAAAGGSLRYDRAFKDDQREMVRRTLEITDSSSH